MLKNMQDKIPVSFKTQIQSNRRYTPTKFPSSEDIQLSNYCDSAKS